MLFLGIDFAFNNEAFFVTNISPILNNGGETKKLVRMIKTTSICLHSLIFKHYTEEPRVSVVDKNVTSQSSTRKYYRLQLKEPCRLPKLANIFSFQQLSFQVIYDHFLHLQSGKADFQTDFQIRNQTVKATVKCQSGSFLIYVQNLNKKLKWGRICYKPQV